MRRLRQDRLPGRNPESALVGRGVPGRRRRVRGTGRIDRRRRAPAAQGDRCNRQRHRVPAQIRLPVHQCAADAKEARFVPAEPILRVVGASGRRPGDARPLGVRRRRLRARGGGNRGREGARISSQHQLHAVQRCRPGARRAVFRRGGRTRHRRHHRIARLCVRAGARSGALPHSHPDQAALPRHFPARPRRARVVIQPIEPVPRFPRRQPGIPLHAVGQPHAQRFRLAATLLSAGRRLCADLS